MPNEKAARRYATAVFELATERDQIDRIGDDLHAMTRALEDDAEIRRYFLAPIVNRTEKAAVLAEVFDGKVDEIALHTLLLLVQKRREALLPEILEVYRRLALASKRLEPLTITSARPLDPDELQHMVGRLSQTYGKQFHVHQEVDPTLIGGIRILLGDRRIDGSISGRLQDLAATLFSRS